MRGYIKNLWAALMGKDPFEIEMNKIKKQSDTTAKQMEALRMKTPLLEKMIDDLKKQVANYEKLTETLRQSVEDKERNITELREDLELALGRLQESNRALAKDVVAQSLLNKTNDGLEDLCAAMQSGDAEQILSLTENLSWSNPLVRIAQIHINVLKRKNELSSRLSIL